MINTPTVFIRAMFTDILGLAREFSPFGAAGRDRSSTSLMPTRFCRPLPAGPRAFSSPALALRRTSARGPWSERP